MMMSLEIDGPKTAYFTAPDGTNHIYTVYAIGALTAWECIQAFAQWRMTFDEPGKILVWRARPLLDECPGGWKITCRCVKIPIEFVNSPLVVKPEGEPVQMM